ncbi:MULTISPECIES: VOC family protein [unclassified Streptomyces]|uniref:VOC family protein n=1 Tax=unclassified Streptomyces TaxID=2593676 RepID=UPI00168B9B11|nr:MULTISPECIES: VOC family protein [unclassified Streptomyces]MBD3007884.1 VOC family protein [Streptomyces sp. 5-10]MBI0377916.1 VOC family protein [Streptomyces albiflaviniger]
MQVARVLMVAPVRDIDIAVAWYERLLGRPADTRPMPSLADWHLTAGGWLQVFEDPEHAGSTLLNLEVPELDSALAGLAERGLAAGPVLTGGVRTRIAALEDPDGNRVTLLENPVA